jgi:TrpR-related protein YerC/YecD
MSQRLEVAALLKEEQSYVQISAKTGASTATIGRVNKCLKYGSGGYQKVLERMSNPNEST